MAHFYHQLRTASKKSFSASSNNDNDKEFVIFFSHTFCQDLDINWLFCLFLQSNMADNLGTWERTKLRIYTKKNHTTIQRKSLVTSQVISKISVCGVYLKLVSDWEQAWWVSHQRVMVCQTCDESGDWFCHGEDLGKWSSIWAHTGVHLSVF